MKSGRNSSYQSRFVVAFFGFLFTAALLSAQTKQPFALTTEERQAREAIEKYVIDGPGKDLLSAAIDALNSLPPAYEGVKPGLNLGMADAIKTTAKIKAENPAHRITVPEDQAFTSVAPQIGILVGQAAEGPYSTPKLREARDRLYATTLRASKSALTSDSIRAADGGAPQSASGGQGKYDPSKSVGLEGPVYREMLKTAAPLVDRVLANASVDQTQAQTAVALERAATINKSMESGRKLPDLLVKSVAVEARALSPEGLEAMRGELQKLVRLGSPNADADEVNAAIDAVIEAAKNGVNPNTPGFENASASLRRYVSAALHSAETGSPSISSSDAGRKGGAQKNLDRR